MKLMAKRLLLPLIIGATYATSAAAGVLLDTGPGGTTLGGYDLSLTQWLAASFTLDDASVVTGFQGWLADRPGTLRVEILSSSKGSPGTSLYVHDIFQPLSAPTQSWVGVSGMDLHLDAGTYFAAFEVPTGYSYHGNMPCCAPKAMLGATMGFGRGSSGVWNLFPRFGLGLQVFGEKANGVPEPTTEVPEPTTLALVGLGIAGLAARRKRA